MATIMEKSDWTTKIAARITYPPHMRRLEAFDLDSGRVYAVRDYPGTTDENSVKRDIPAFLAGIA
jgi:hypothetical protein